MSGVLGGSVQNYLEDLIFRIPHLHLLLVTDRDGVELIKATSDSFSDHPLDPSYSSIFSTASDQASKLSLGLNVYIMAQFHQYITLQVDFNPLVITAVGDKQVNVGLLINAIPEMKVKLEGTRNGVQLHQQSEKDKERM